MGDASGTAPYDTVEFNPLDPRGRTYINQVFSIRLEGARGPVVIGDRGRITNSHEREHTPFNQDHANTIQNSRTRPSTSGTTPQTSDTTASISEGNTHTQPEKPINQLSSYTSTDVNILYAKIGTPGGYCNRTYYQHSNVGDWNPRPINGILFQRGEIEFEWTVESFLENPERFIQEMDTCAGSVKKGKEQFILQGILPYLERYMWGKSSANNIDTYRVLAQASCCRSGDVVKHSLQQLLHFLYRDGLENYKQNLLSVEEIIRLSIVSPDGMLGNEAHPTQVLRLSVYGRILSEQVVHKIQTGFSRIDLKNILEELEEVKAFFNQITPQKKDILRYSMEFIQEAVSYLLPRSPTTHLARYLEECEAFCANSQTAVKKFLLFRRLRKSQVKWFDLHCVLRYLHGKLHNEHPTPEMHKERRAMILLRRVVEVYLDYRGGRDWSFCLLSASLLSDISMNNATKEIRIEAGACLVSLLKNQGAQKSPECRAILDCLSKRVLFCQDSPTKKLLVPHLYDNQNTQDTLPAELLIEHLTNDYKTQTLEINNPIVRTSDHHEPSFFVYDGTLKGQKVAVKILSVTKQDVLEGGLTEQSEGKKRLIAEAYNLWQLNNLNRHPNIPVLLAYNTETLPYHIVTEYEKYGNLLQLVRASREAQILASPVLYKMLIGITEGLLYLTGKHLVHRAIMAENVLVGDGHTCKLSGLHSLVMPGYRPCRDAEDDYDYARGDDGFPECISENDKSLPVRWKAPECLQEHSYSTPSDVWAFGVLMYEVFTFGCLPYRHIGQDDLVASHVLQKNNKGILPKERCLNNDEYKLMMQCWKRQRRERIELLQLSKELKKMRLKMGSGEPRSSPPALGVAIDNPSAVDDVHGDVEDASEDAEDSLTRKNPTQGLESGSDLYCSISEVLRDRNSQSTQEDQDLYEECGIKEVAQTSQRNSDDLLSKMNDFPKRELIQDISAVSENIARENVQHLKKLLALKHPNLVSIWKIDSLDSHGPTVKIISADAPLGNLKEYVLDQQCRIEDIVTYLSQVASALHYLHVNHIVHGDLRAEYVNVIAPEKVQVSRLGRSKSLHMSDHQVTSTSCVIKTTMPPYSTRWSAPEVISDGRYTHASDVWAFGVLAWELYTSFTNGQDGREISVPFSGLNKHEIISHLDMKRDNGPLTKPEGCPDWVYIIMQQCWAYESVQRPPFLAIFDCLTSREPMKSWIMTFWLANHDQSERPDLSSCQAEDACHVANNRERFSVDDIKKMCSDQFLAKTYNHITA